MRGVSFTCRSVTQYPRTVEPKKQIEIQLGHMCNNRCVFCVSGQETARGNAGPLDVAPMIAAITRAHQDGHRKLTLLGGEPTLQPGFLDVVRHAVALGFDGDRRLHQRGEDRARGVPRRDPRDRRQVHLAHLHPGRHGGGARADHAEGRLVRPHPPHHGCAARRGASASPSTCAWCRSNHASVAAFPALVRPLRGEPAPPRHGAPHRRRAAHRGGAPRHDPALLGHGARPRRDGARLPGGLRRQPRQPPLLHRAAPGARDPPRRRAHAHHRHGRRRRAEPPLGQVPGEAARQDRSRRAAGPASSRAGAAACSRRTAISTARRSWCR